MVQAQHIQTSIHTRRQQEDNTVQKPAGIGNTFGCLKCYMHIATYIHQPNYNLPSRVQMSNSYRVGAISEARCCALNASVSPA